LIQSQNLSQNHWQVSREMVKTIADTMIPAIQRMSKAKLEEWCTTVGLELGTCVQMRRSLRELKEAITGGVAGQQTPTSLLGDGEVNKSKSGLKRRVRHRAPT